MKVAIGTYRAALITNYRGHGKRWGKISFGNGFTLRAGRIALHLHELDEQIMEGMSEEDKQAYMYGDREGAELLPWAKYHGPLPDYDHPLRPVYESGIQYAVELLAKMLKVDDWEVCDGTEEFDGDLGGTLLNIVLAAMPKDEHGDPIFPSELPARLQAEARMSRMQEALEELATAEQEYRYAHDHYGDGDRRAGRAWDLMRRAGDKARATLGDR